MLNLEEVNNCPPLEEGAGFTLLSKEQRITLIKTINTLFSLDRKGRKKGVVKLTEGELELLDLVRGDLFSYDVEGNPDPKEEHLLKDTLTYFPR